MRPLVDTPADQIPVSLWAQLRRHSPRYGIGLLLLGAYQSAQYWFDTRLMRGINAAVSGERVLATQVGMSLVALAIAAFAIRVLSRVAIFNGGRIALRSLLQKHPVTDVTGSSPSNPENGQLEYVGMYVLMQRSIIGRIIGGQRGKEDPG